ncbi:hypothetical protein V8E54_011334 [Elaphomyces granulatus]
MSLNDIEPLNNGRDQLSEVKDIFIPLGVQGLFIVRIFLDRVLIEIQGQAHNRWFRGLSTITAHPHHSDYSEAIQHFRVTRQSQKARQSDKRRGLKVVKEEEEKQQGHKGEGQMNGGEWTASSPRQMRPYQGPVVVKTQVWMWLLPPSATTTDSKRCSRTPETQSHLISMSARVRLPTSNTFELIGKWKLIKEEEEKQQQKVKVRWTVPTLLPRLS